MNDHRDGEISARYRALSDDAPPAALDEAIRAAARAAPPQAIAGPGRPWFVRRAAPMALAATVLLSVGVVTRMVIERPDLQPPSEVASAPASVPESASVPPSAPLPAEARQEAATPTPQAPIARLEKKSRAAAPAGPAPQAETSPAPSSAERELAAEAPVRPADKRESAAPSATGTAIADARPAVAGNAPTTAASDRADTALGASASGNVAQPERKQSRQMQDAPRAAALRTEPAPAQASASVQAPAPASVQAPASAPAPARATTAAPAPAASEQALEARFSADEWIKRILDLRRTGRHAEADASLLRFMQRYPQFRVPPEAGSGNAK